MAEKEKTIPTLGMFVVVEEIHRPAGEEVHDKVHVSNKPMRNTKPPQPPPSEPELDGSEVNCRLERRSRAVILTV